MPVKLEALGYKTVWTNISVDTYEGYTPNMSDYHIHEYYEISLIKTGDVSVLLPNEISSSKEPRLVFIRPKVPHYIYCKANDLLYTRTNVLFDTNFISDFISNSIEIMSLFSPEGKIVPLDEQSLKKLTKIIEFLNGETDIYRKKLCLLYFLSTAFDVSKTTNSKSTFLPSYVNDVLSYISVNYAKKIKAEDVAWELKISRTTLLTQFKRYVGINFYEYLTQCRLKYAINELKTNKTEDETAFACGFTTSGNMIRAFKKYFGITPKQFIKNN